jgi:hypothetical protein
MGHLFTIRPATVTPYEFTGASSLPQRHIVTLCSELLTIAEALGKKPVALGPVQ